MLSLGSMGLGLLIAGLAPGCFNIEIGPLLVGGILAALECRLRRPALTTFLAVLTIEELLVWWALTSGDTFRSVEGTARAGPFLVGVCIAALLLARVRLP